MRFRIDLKIFLFFILFYFTKQIQTYSLMMIFAIIHELGHLITGVILGMKPEKIELIPYGLTVSFKLKPEDYNLKVKKANKLECKKIVVAFAGPLTNILIIVISILFNKDFITNLIILYTNILLIVFNLLPLYPLDGGRILKGLLHIFLGNKKAQKYINIISKITLSIVTILASFSILFLKNFAIFIIIIYLWIIFLKEEKRYVISNKIYDALNYKDTY